MRDLISRSDAIDAINDLPDCPNGYSDTYDKACIIGVIEELPSVYTDAEIQKIQDLEQAQFNKMYQLGYEDGLAERSWVPCNAKLPEENTPVLLGVRLKDDFKYFVTARTDYNYWTGLGRDIRGELAWMPLPEPWKGEANDT